MAKTVKLKPAKAKVSVRKVGNSLKVRTTTNNGMSTRTTAKYTRAR